MKLYIEFKNNETKMIIKSELDKRGFDTSYNSCGTLFINNIEFISYELDSIKIENKGLHDYQLNLKDISYLEIQK